MTAEPTPYHVRVERAETTVEALGIIAEGIDELLFRRKPDERTLPSDAILEVWGDYQQVFDRPRATLTLKRRRAISGRLKDGFTRERMRRAFEGCEASDFHMKRGRYANRDGGLFCDLELILRDGATVERFEEMPTQQEADPVLMAFRFAESAPHMQVHQAVATALSQGSDPGGILKDKAYALLKEANNNVAKAVELRQGEFR